ncbi:MAG: ABC transporter ATP-binding protein [Chloroflexi bacterium]|nr:ABC transporter ATP-binding protein [Chloroflexota bacterium]
MAEAILEVKNLKTYFYVQDGELRAVDGLSYRIRKGECVALVGESACGKSVSALSVMRLIPYPPGIIVDGQIIFEGRDLLQVSEEEMRDIRGNRIAMVFQEPTTSLNPVLTVKRQLSESLELHRSLDKKAAAEEAAKLLKLVGIPDSERRINDYPHQFSGGMQQRIMIAMALSCNPALLIADEPTTSVDVTVQAQLLEIINNLRTQFGTAVIIITHNLGVVARYADSVNVMYAGRLMETGPTDVIYDAPRHPYTVGLIASVPRLDLPRKRDLSVIEGLPPNLARLPRTMCPFSPRCKLAITRCRTQRPELEVVGKDHYSACWRSSEVPELMSQLVEPE